MIILGCDFFVQVLKKQDIGNKRMELFTNPRIRRFRITHSVLNVGSSTAYGTAEESLMYSPV